jgi:uncharacterized protein (DUF433 family)/plastocyanin
VNYKDIITIEPGKRGGKPCIRGMRITVYDVLDYLASGMTIEEIVDDLPYLNKADIQACLAYAADREKAQMFVRVNETAKEVQNVLTVFEAIKHGFLSLITCFNNNFKRSSMMKTKVATILTLFIASVYVTAATAAGGDEAVESLVFPASYKAMSVSNGGTISGMVKFDGAAPEMKKLEITKDTQVCGKIDKFDESIVLGEGNGLKNTIVYLIDISSGADFPSDPKVKYEIDQKGCHFEPHVSLLPVGKRLTMINPDRINHNVHIFSSVNPAFNKSQPGSRRKMNVKAVKKAEGPVPVKCDVHGWMKGWIAYIPHPYFAVSDENGKYTIENVPPGTYKLAYWQEACGTNKDEPVSVTVETGGTVAQDFALALKK